MVLMRWLVAVFGALLCIGFWGVQIANSYLLPSQQIIEFVARHTSRVSSFRLDTLTETPVPNIPEAKVKREIVYYAARPDFLRQEINDGSKSVTILAGAGRRLSVIDNQLLEEAPRHEELFPILLTASSVEILKRVLAAEQVDMNRVHLGRMGRQIAYVIGGSPRDKEAPQFWCDKDRFLPLRLIGRRSREGVADLVDIRFIDYRKVANDVWMPSVIEFYRQNQLFLRLSAQQIGVNEKMPKALFDLEAFASKYPPLKVPKEPVEEPAEVLEEMRRYLEKKYE